MPASLNFTNPIPWAAGQVRRRFIGQVVLAPGANFTIGSLTRATPTAMPMVFVFAAFASATANNFGPTSSLVAGPQSLIASARKNVGTPGLDDYTLFVDNALEDPPATLIGATCDLALLEFTP